MDKMRSRKKNFVMAASFVVFFMAMMLVSVQNVHGTSGGWETEENEYRSNADSISVNATYYGSSQESYDWDYYWFETSSDGTVTVTFNHEYLNSPNTYWEVSLLDSDGDMIVSENIAGNEESTSLTKVGLPAGTYYLEVCQSGTWSASTYNFKVTYAASSVWETEDNDSRYDADGIAVNKTYYGNSMDKYDWDYYWLKTSASGTVELTFHHDYINSSTSYWNVYLLDADGDTIISEVIAGNKTSTKLTKVGLPAGTYYVGVNTGGTWSTSAYNLKAAYAASSVWETEDNDSRYDADAISLGNRHYGNIMDRYGADYYWLRLSKKTKVSLNFKHGYIKSASRYWQINLIDGSGYHYIETNYSQGKKGNSTYDLGYLSAGNYYIRVSNADKHSVKDYSIKVYKNNKPYGTKITGIKGAKKAAVLKWKKSSDAKGYEIYRADKKNGKYKKVKTITKKSTVKFTNKKLKKGKKYYYKVRSYKVVNGKKYYSSFSTVRSVKAK